MKMQYNLQKFLLECEFLNYSYINYKKNINIMSNNYCKEWRDIRANKLLHF